MEYQLQRLFREKAKEALAPPDFEGSEKRTERETDNLFLFII